MARMEPGPSVNAEDISSGIFVDLKVTRPSFFGGGTVQYRRWSPTANDPQNGPQMIPKVDRKWSRKKNGNDLDSS